MGLKENVIIGKLIPAATGLRDYRNIEIAPRDGFGDSLLNPADYDDDALEAELAVTEDDTSRSRASTWPAKRPTRPRTRPKTCEGPPTGRPFVVLEAARGRDLPLKKDPQRAQTSGQFSRSVSLVPNRVCARLPVLLPAPERKPEMRDKTKVAAALSTLVTLASVAGRAKGW